MCVDNKMYWRMKKVLISLPMRKLDGPLVKGRQSIWDHDRTGKESHTLKT